jgi:hypothetical protein
MLYRIHFDKAGLSQTGLTPTWKSLLTAVESGTDKSGSAPTISEIGGGFYTFDIEHEIAPWDDITKDLVGEIDGGSSLVGRDRYKLIVITLRGLALARLAHERAWAAGVERVYGVDGIAGGNVDLTLTHAGNEFTVG